MNKTERDSLQVILAQLRDMQEFTPFNVTYKSGRVQANISLQLRDIIANVEELLGDTKSERTTEQD